MSRVRGAGSEEKRHWNVTQSKRFLQNFSSITPVPFHWENSGGEANHCTFRHEE